MVDVSGVKGISETMLLPLMGRAMETRRADGIINDPKSLEVFNRIDYDFNKFDGSDIKSSTARTVIRTCIIDRMVREFIERHTDATIVEIGCGLNTRFSRLDNGMLRWFDLDVKEVYRVWGEFFAEDERRSFLPYSAFEEAWMKEVIEKGSHPYFFISEASVIYFSGHMIKKLFINLKKYFPGCYYLFDSATGDFLDMLSNSDDPLKYCNADMRWCLEDIGVLNDWVGGVRVVKRVDVEDSENSFSHLYPKHFNGYKGAYYLNLIKM